MSSGDNHALTQHGKDNPVKHVYHRTDSYPGAYAAEKFKAITTFTVVADMAQNVAGTLQKPILLPGLAQISMNISLQPEL